MNKRKHRTATAGLAVIALLLIAAAVFPVRVFAGENLPVTLDISVTYIVNGNVKSAGGDRFTLKADDPLAPMPEGTCEGQKTITIRDEGRFSFGSIYYDKPQVWWYTVTRETENKKDVTKDTAVYRAKVIALNDGHGYVLVYKEGSNEKTDLVYTDRVAPETGDTSLPAYSVMLFASSAAALLLTAIRRRGRKG